MPPAPSPDTATPSTHAAAPSPDTATPPASLRTYLASRLSQLPPLPPHASLRLQRTSSPDHGDLTCPSLREYTGVTGLSALELATALAASLQTYIEGARTHSAEPTPDRHSAEPTAAHSLALMENNHQANLAVLTRLVTRAQAAPPGFLNLTLSPQALALALNDMLAPTTTSAPFPNEISVINSASPSPLRPAEVHLALQRCHGLARMGLAQGYMLPERIYEKQSLYLDLPRERTLACLIEDTPWLLADLKRHRRPAILELRCRQIAATFNSLYSTERLLCGPRRQIETRLALAQACALALTRLETALVDVCQAYFPHKKGISRNRVLRAENS